MGWASFEDVDLEKSSWVKTALCMVLPSTGGISGEPPSVAGCKAIAARLHGLINALNFSS